MSGLWEFVGPAATGIALVLAWNCHRLQGELRVVLARLKKEQSHAAGLEKLLSKFHQHRGSNGRFARRGGDQS